MKQKILDSIKKSRFIISPLSIFNHSFVIRKWIFHGLLEARKYIWWNVLDFWCWEKPYKEIFNFKNYIWVDIKVSWHDNSQNEVDVFWDWKTLPFENNYFDSVISTEVFEHIFDPKNSINQIHRVLKKWWYIVITTPFSIHEHEIPYDNARYTQYWIENLFTSNWFEKVYSNQYWNYFSTLCQLNIWMMWKFFQSFPKPLNLILWWFLLLPCIIIINFFHYFFSTKTNWTGILYLTNIFVWKKI